MSPMSAIQLPFLWSQANIALQIWRPEKVPASPEVQLCARPLVTSRVLWDDGWTKRPPRQNRLHWCLHLPCKQKKKQPVKWRGPWGPRPLGSSKPNTKATQSAQCLQAERVRVSSAAGTNLNGSNSYPTRGFRSARKCLICLTAPLASVRIGCQTIAPPHALDTPPMTMRALIFQSTTRHAYLTDGFFSVCRKTSATNGPWRDPERPSQTNSWTNQLSRVS